MKKKRIFFQDFLFEDLPIDEQDYPTVDFKELPENEDASDYVVVSFDRLLRMDDEKEWEELFGQAKDKSVCIKDDVPMNNSETEYYKTFYLRVYCHVLSRYCRNVYVTA